MRFLRRRTERGAVALLAALTVTVLLIAAAMTVDIGMQRVVRTDMQTVADVASLDVARVLRDSNDPADFSAALASSLARNQANLGKTVPSRGRCIAPGSAGAPMATTVVTGACWEFMKRATDGKWVYTSSAAEASGIRVYARTETEYVFSGVVASGDDSGGATRSSVASLRVPSVCFSVGAKTLTLNTSQSALSPLLNSILKVNLDAVGYNGLVDLKSAEVPLLDLMAELNVGSVGQVATTSVSLAKLMVAAADVLRAKGNTAAAEVLEAVNLGVPGIPVNLGRILDLGTATDLAGLEADLNVLDIIGAGIVAANGDTGIGVTVPGVTALKITQPPRIACGGKGATATSGQIELKLNPTLVTAGIPGLISGGVDLTVTVGQAIATVDADIECLPDVVPMKVTTSGVSLGPGPQIGLTVTLDKFLDPIPALLRAPLVLPLRLLGVDRINLDVFLAGGVSVTEEKKRVTYEAPPADPPTVTLPENGVAKALTLSVADVDASLGQGGLLSILNPVLDLALSGIVTPVVNPVVGLLNAALTPIFNALTDILGLKLGVADVHMMGRPICNGVKLVG